MTDFRGYMESVYFFHTATMPTTFVIQLGHKINLPGGKIVAGAVCLPVDGAYIYEQNSLG